MAEHPVLLIEAGNLLAPDLVDLAGVHRQRGVAVDVAGIGGFAVGEPVEAGLVDGAGGGAHFVGDHVAVALVGGPDRFDDGVEQLVLPLRDGGGVESGGGADVEQHVFGRGGVEVGVELCDGLVDHQIRRGPTAGDAFAEPLGHLVEERAKGAELGDQCFGMLRQLDGELRHDHRQHRLEAHRRVDGKFGRSGLFGLGFGAAGEDEHFAGDSFVWGEPCGIDRFGGIGKGTQASNMGVLSGT